MCRSRCEGALAAVSFSTAVARGGMMTSASGARAATARWMGSPSYAPSASTVPIGPAIWSSSGPTSEASPSSVLVDAEARIAPVSGATARCGFRHVRRAAPWRAASRRRSAAAARRPERGRPAGTVTLLTTPLPGRALRGMEPHDDAPDPRYAGHRYPAEAIATAVWLYFRFPLSLRMACCSEVSGARDRPSPVGDQATRTEFGRPRSSMRLRTMTPMATSVACA